MVWLSSDNQSNDDASEETRPAVKSHSSSTISSPKKTRKRGNPPIVVSPHDDSSEDGSLESLPRRSGATVSITPGSSSSSSSKPRKVHKKRNEPIVVSSYDDSWENESVTSLSSKPNLSSLIEQVVVDRTASETREPSNMQRFLDKEVTQTESRESVGEEIFFDTATVANDESQSVEWKAQGELGTKSSSSLQESVVRIQSVDEQASSSGSKSRAFQPDASSIEIEEQAASPASERRVIALGKSMSKAVSSRLHTLKAKRRKSAEEDKVMSGHLQSLRSKRKKVAALDSMLAETEQTKEVPIKSEVVASTPKVYHVKTVVANDGIETGLDGTSTEDETDDHRSLVNTDSDDETSVDRVPTNRLLVTPPFMKDTDMNADVLEESPRTIAIVLESPSGDPESLPPVERATLKTTNAGDSDTMQSWWTFAVCCSLAFLCCNNVESSVDDREVQDMILSPAAEDSESATVEKDPKDVDGEETTKRSLEKQRPQINLDEKGRYKSSQEAPDRSVERAVLIPTTEHQTVDEHPSQVDLAHSLGRKESQEKVRSTHDSLEEQSSLVQEESVSNRILHALQAINKKNDGNLAVAKPVCSQERQSTSDIRIDAARSDVIAELPTKMLIPTNSLISEGSDTTESIYPSESEAIDMAASFDSNGSIPWWQKEEINSADSAGWTFPFVVEPGSETIALGHACTAPSLTEYSQADLWLSESQLSIPSYDSDADLVSMASSAEDGLVDGTGMIEEQAESTPHESGEENVHQTLEKAKSSDSVAVKGLGEQDLKQVGTKDILGGTTAVTLDVANDTAGDEDANCEKESAKVVGALSTGTAQVVERKRIRVFSKAMSHSVSRSIQRRATQMKARKANRRKEAILIESGLSVDEGLPSIVETNESSNASSTTASITAQITIRGSKSGVEVDDASLRSMENDMKGTTPPVETESPRSVLQIKSFGDVEAVMSGQPTSILPADSSFQDAFHGELEIYMV